MSAVDHIQRPDGYQDQIKAWYCTGELYQLGSRVPSIKTHWSYDIVMREGYIIRVETCIITAFIPLKDYDFGQVPHPVYDKWGDPFLKSTTGISGEPYFLKDPDA